MKKSCILKQYWVQLVKSRRSDQTHWQWHIRRSSRNLRKMDCVFELAWYFRIPPNVLIVWCLVFGVWCLVFGVWWSSVGSIQWSEEYTLFIVQFVHTGLMVVETISECAPVILTKWRRGLNCTLGNKVQRNISLVCNVKSSTIFVIYVYKGRLSCNVNRIVCKQTN